MIFYHLKLYGLVIKNWTCKDIPVSASDFVPSRLLIDQLCISIFQCCAFLDVHLTRQRGLKMAIIGSDAHEFYKLVSIILIYLKMLVYVGNVI
jgi:hypothetical protein